jgi:hypothetical protein
MNNISIDQLEQKIETGTEIIDTYFASHTTRIGKTYETIERRKKNIQKNLELPDSMVQEINLIADELNINSDAVIKMMLRRSLDEHYLAKKQVLLSSSS